MLFFNKILIIVTCIILTSAAYEIQLDKQTDSKLWRITGNYVYASSLRDGGRLTPGIKSSNSSGTTKGVWYFKHVPSEDINDNYFEISYSLTHALYQEVYVRLLAHPSAEVKILGSHNEALGTFHSTGTAWCDAVVSKILTRSLKLSVNLTEPGSYAVIDKIILGVFSKIKYVESAELNLCSGITTYPDGITHDNYEGLLEFDTTTRAPTTFKPVTEPNSVVKERQYLELENLDSENSTFVRAVRDIVPTTTSTTSTVDGASCTCSCTCSKPINSG